MSGEYWLQKAQSDNDVLTVCGMVEGTYLPRRTSQRRLNNALALSLDSQQLHSQHYTPFLSPTQPLGHETRLNNALALSLDSQQLHSQHYTPFLSPTQPLGHETRLINALALSLDSQQLHSQHYTPFLSPTQPLGHETRLNKPLGHETRRRRSSVRQRHTEDDSRSAAVMSPNDQQVRLFYYFAGP